MNIHPPFGLALLVLVTSSLPLSAAPQADAQAPAQTRAAWGNGIELTRAELNPVLVSRYAMTSEGRATLTHLLKTRLLDRMAKERHMEITDADLDQRIAELNAEMRAEGAPGDVYSNLRASDVSIEEFRRLLGYALVQERLCREALGIPPDRAVSNGQQEAWIDEEMKGRGVVAPAPPWKDGIAGRCGDAFVTAEDYRAALMLELNPDQVRETCYQMLLAKGIRSRMQDISEETYEAAVDLEIERRRQSAEANPAYQGMSFERLLSTQNMTIELLRNDPAVQVTALSQLWILRSHSDESLRRTYQEERMLFDSTFGEALLTRVLFLRAGAVRTPKNPRSYDEALALVHDLAAEIRTEAEFELAAGRNSEDSASRTKGGLLGWLSGVGQGLEELRGAAFDDLRLNGPLPEGGRMIEPFRNSTGVVLAWLSEHRPAPSWEEMRVHIRTELRKRFLMEVLPRESMVTLLD